MQITLNIPLIDRISGIFSKIPLTPRHTPREETSESSHNISEYYYRKILLENTRKAQYADYRTMDDDYPEVASALDLYADYATKENDEEGTVIEVRCDDAKAKNIIDELYDRIRMQDILWDTARGIVKMGDEWDEIVVNEEDLIVRLKALPPESMSIDLDQYGRWKDKPYIQKDVDSGAKIADFFGWQIIHWKLGATKRLYGVSILRPIRRVYKQVQLMEDHTIISLLTRAYLRYKFLIDTEGMTADERLAHVQKVKNDIKKKRLINPRTGVLDTTQNPLTAQEDFFLAVTKDSKADVGAVQGQANYAQIITAVQHFQDKMFVGLKTPKALYGIVDPKVRASIIEQVIQFATAVGRARKSLRRGITKITDRQLLLAGVQADKDLYEIQFDKMSEVDEMRKWTTEKLKAEIAKIYKVDVGLPLTDEYILKNFAGLSEEDIAGLLKEPTKDVKGAIDANKKTDQALRASASTGLAATGATAMKGKQAAAEGIDGGNGEDKNFSEIIRLSDQLRELVHLELNQ